jgi:hypothetical protein
MLSVRKKMLLSTEKPKMFQKLNKSFFPLTIEFKSNHKKVKILPLLTKKLHIKTKFSQKKLQNKAQNESFLNLVPE